jgi:hypothetical protein
VVQSPPRRDLAEGGVVRPSFLDLAELWVQEIAATRYLEYLDTVAPRTLVEVDVGLKFSVELLRETVIKHRAKLRAAIDEAAR